MVNFNPKINKGYECKVKIWQIKHKKNAYFLFMVNSFAELCTEPDLARFSIYV